MYTCTSQKEWLSTTTRMPGSIWAEAAHSQGPGAVWRCGRTRILLTAPCSDNRKRVDHPSRPSDDEHSLPAVTSPNRPQSVPLIALDAPGGNMEIYMRGPTRVTLGLLVLSIPLSAVAQEQSPDPLRFEETIREWEAQDALNPPPPNAIYITGSSSITRWNHEMVEDLAPLTVLPRGFGGSEMSDVLHYIDRLAFSSRPRAIVIYEGDNDTGRSGKKAETIVGEFRQIVAKIHDALPETRIHVLSVKPSVLRWGVWPEVQRTNVLLQEVAAADDLVYYIDVSTPLLQPNGEVMTDIFVDDNLHFNEKGTDIWAATILNGLSPVEARYESSDR